MSIISITTNTPHSQAKEPDEFWVYVALCIYRDEHPDLTDNDLYQSKVTAAYQAYLNTFVGG